MVKISNLIFCIFLFLVSTSFVYANNLVYDDTLSSFNSSLWNVVSNSPIYNSSPRGYQFGSDSTLRDIYSVYSFVNNSNSYMGVSFNYTVTAKGSSGGSGAQLFSLGELPINSTSSEVRFLSNGYYVVLASNTDGTYKCNIIPFKVVDYTPTILTPFTCYNVTIGTMYNVRSYIYNNSFYLYVNNTLIYSGASSYNISNNTILYMQGKYTSAQYYSSYIATNFSFIDVNRSLYLYLSANTSISTSSNVSNFTVSIGGANYTTTSGLVTIYGLNISSVYNITFTNISYGGAIFNRSFNNINISYDGGESYYLAESFYPGNIVKINVYNLYNTSLYSVNITNLTGYTVILNESMYVYNVTTGTKNIIISKTGYTNQSSNFYINSSIYLEKTYYLVNNSGISFKIENSSSNRTYEYGSVVNISVSNVLYPVCLDVFLYGYGINYVCGDTPFSTLIRLENYTEINKINNNSVIGSLFFRKSNRDSFFVSIPNFISNFTSTTFSVSGNDNSNVTGFDDWSYSDTSKVYNLVNGTDYVFNISVRDNNSFIRASFDIESDYLSYLDLDICNDNVNESQENSTFYSSTNVNLDVDALNNCSGNIVNDVEVIPIRMRFYYGNGSINFSNFNVRLSDNDYPSNVKIDVGNDSYYDFEFTGELNGNTGSVNVFSDDSSSVDLNGSSGSNSFLVNISVNKFVDYDNLSFVISGVSSSDVFSEIFNNYSYINTTNSSVVFDTFWGMIKTNESIGVPVESWVYSKVIPVYKNISYVYLDVDEYTNGSGSNSFYITNNCSTWYTGVNGDIVVFNTTDDCLMYKVKMSPDSSFHNYIYNITISGIGFSANNLTIDFGNDGVVDFNISNLTSSTVVSISSSVISSYLDNYCFESICDIPVNISFEGNAVVRVNNVEMNYNTSGLSVDSNVVRVNLINGRTNFTNVTSTYLSSGILDDSGLMNRSLSNYNSSYDTNGYYNFTGYNNYLNTTRQFNITTYTNYTMCSDIYILNKTNVLNNVYASAICNWQTNTRNGTCLYVINVSSNSMKFAFVYANSTSYTGTNSANFDYRNSWHTVCGVKTNYSTYTNLSLYIDGNYTSSVSTNIVATQGTSGNNMLIGAYGTGSSYSMNGSIDNVMIFNSSLNSSQISDLYNSISPYVVSPGSIVDYYTFSNTSNTYFVSIPNTVVVSNASVTLKGDYS